MNPSEWVGIGGVAVAFASLVRSWFKDHGRAQREAATFMTRAEHDQICKERNERVEKQVDDLRTDMENRYADMENRQERRHAENSATLSAIASTVTGTHRRVDEVLLALVDRSGGR
jgi:exonuclease VII large subunit